MNTTTTTTRQPVPQQPQQVQPQQGQPIPSIIPPGVTDVAPFNSTSLYVGDLNPDINETQLLDVFKQVGTVASIRVCRDAITRRSLGYGYVNFHNPQDAENALNLLNYKEIRGKPMRIMWSQRDPALRKLGNSNVFIKNLDASIDAKALYDAFSTFGSILSCKVSTDEQGRSRGFGFVHFENQESAAKAVEKLNGKLLNGKKAFVGSFIPKKERVAEIEKAPKWTNVFVKNLDASISEERLRKVFGKYGSITSIFLSQKGELAKNQDYTKEETEGKNKTTKHAFINFANHDEAAQAVEELNGSKVDDSDATIYVGKAQKKSEREKELKSMFDRLKSERISKYQGVNLFVKNLDDSVDDNRLRTEFESCGTIANAKVMRDERTKVSKGFGFVCFSTPDEATKAVTELNGKMIANKPIFVALAERKDQRRQKLEMQFSSRNPMRGMPVYGFYPPVQRAYSGMYPPMIPARGRAYTPVRQPAYPSMYYPGPLMRSAPVQRGVPQQNYKTPMRQLGQSPQVPSNPEINDKHQLGEFIYPIIDEALKRHKRQELTGKITGMLLDGLEYSELNKLISPGGGDMLDKKILEALELLDH